MPAYLCTNPDCLWRDVLGRGSTPWVAAEGTLCECGTVPEEAPGVVIPEPLRLPSKPLYGG